MKIRAVTLGMDLADTAEGGDYAAASQFLTHAVASFGAVGLEVQTTRVAGPDLGPRLASLDREGFADWAAYHEAAAKDAGIGYLSLGRVPAHRPEVVEHWLPAVLAAGSIAFLSADLLHDGRPSIAMARAAANAVGALAERTPLGFGNLRFAATASCPPNIPFLPAAYHVGGPPRFAIAVEAADVVLEALGGTDPVANAEDRLVERLEAAMAPIEDVGRALERVSGFPFVGIDLSPAPYPTDAVSIGGAVEALGVDRFGAPGTVFAASLVTRAVKRTKVRRSGFSGLMLPVLEDSVLARRTAERPTSLHELLLYSAVCGTGLDTIPVPGDVSVEELAGTYLDVAAFSVALGGKPLTVRLLPVPGARAGDPTTYDFEYFSNSRVGPAAGAGVRGILARG